MKKKIGFGILIILVAIQFFQIDKTQPPSVPGQDIFAMVDNVDPQLGSQIKKACFDCHSNVTRYPWYTNIAPVSWWIKGHIDNGREELNFSEVASYPPGKFAHKMEECAEMLREKEMPLLTYMIMHNDAWLDAEERERMAVFFEGLSKR